MFKNLYTFQELIFNLYKGEGGKPVNGLKMLF